MTDQELTGRVALVTGAGRNIGRSIALSLAAGGAAVIVNTRSNRAEADGVVKEIEAACGKAMAAVADVVDAPAIEKIVAAAVERFGPIDIPVNNGSAPRVRSSR
jgi:3-oxoacyl-[acyl-carrier protein] reductase